MAVPKKRTSKAKGRSRRASNWTLKPPHVVCGNCGWYGGRQAIEVD